MFLSYSHSPRLRSLRKRRADRRGTAIDCKRRWVTERRQQGTQIRRRPAVRAPAQARRAPAQARRALRRRRAPAWAPILRTRRRRRPPRAGSPIPARLPERRAPRRAARARPAVPMRPGLDRPGPGRVAPRARAPVLLDPAVERAGPVARAELGVAAESDGTSGELTEPRHSAPTVERACLRWRWWR